MRVRVCAFLALWGASLVGVGGSVPSASADPASAGPGVPALEFEQHVRALWNSSQFGELEKIATQSRDGKLRCSDGYWQLAHFYNVLRRRDDPTNRDMWLDMIDKAQRWVNDSPRSVTAKIVLAGAWNGYAWYNRGSCCATDPIDPDERTLFLDRLGKARAILEEAQKVPVSDPQLLHIMLYVARGEGWPRQRYEELFQKAIRQEPTYYAYYLEKTQYLLPKWYGRPGDLAKFAAEAGDATQALEGDVIYSLVAINAYFNTLGENRTWKNAAFFQQQGFSWPRTKKGFEDFDKRFPDSPGNLNWFALLACVVGDKDTTRALLDRLGTNRQRDHWPNEGMFEECRDWSHDAH